LKNQYVVNGDTTRIFISRRNGEVLEVLIDTEDLEKLLQIPLTMVVFQNNHNKNYYPKFSKRKNNRVITTLLSRLIMNASTPCKINCKLYSLGLYSTPEEAGAVAEEFRRNNMPYSYEAYSASQGV
jgi:hypothetical protein